mgnify:FL=1
MFGSGKNTISLLHEEAHRRKRRNYFPTLSVNSFIKWRPGNNGTDWANVELIYTLCLIPVETKFDDSFQKLFVFVIWTESDAGSEIQSVIEIESKYHREGADTD